MKDGRENMLARKSSAKPGVYPSVRVYVKTRMADEPFTNHRPIGTDFERPQG